MWFIFIHIKVETVNGIASFAYTTPFPDYGAHMHYTDATHASRILYKRISSEVRICIF